MPSVRPFARHIALALAVLIVGFATVAGVTVAGSPAAVAVEAAPAVRATAPPIVWKPIAFTAKRRADTAAYGERHYASASYRLRPRVIVLHYTAGGTWLSTWNYFSVNRADAEYHELPGPAAHYIIGKDGTIYQLLKTNYRGRHTVGLNHQAIGIEFVQEGGSGPSWADRQILNRTRQVRAGLRLVRYLKARYGIGNANVIGHAMANASPYFKDLKGWRNTHVDWQRADILVFRSRL